MGKHQLAPDSLIHFAGLDDSLASDTELCSSLEVAFKLASGLQKSATDSAKAFVCVTDMGGDFGLSSEDKSESTLQQLSVVGFTKALAKEWPHALVKVIDVDTEAKGLDVQITAELFCADAAVEVGFSNDERLTVVLEPIEVATEASVALDKSDVVLVTGGAKGLAQKLPFISPSSISVALF